MYVWDQSKGELSKDGKLVSVGYSGANRGKNNPSMQAATAVGPIPQGDWTITDKYDSATTGPFTIVVMPNEDTNTFGRSAFRIHGDSIAHPGSASHGCIILPRQIRERIWASADRQLRVIA